MPFSIDSILFPFGILFVVWVTLFQLFRTILIASTWNYRGDVKSSTLIGSMIHGLRFDFSTAAKWVALFGLWGIWRGDAAGGNERWTVFMIHSVLCFLSVFILVCEVEYYKEFQMRLGPLAIDYFSTNGEHNAIIFKMIWKGYPVVRWMVLCVCLLGVMMTVSFPLIFVKSNPSHWIYRGLETLGLAFITVILIRGGFQSQVLRWGNAYFSNNTYANHMTMNGLFALVDTLVHFNSSKKDHTRKWMARLEFGEAIETVRNELTFKEEVLVKPETFPMLRMPSPEPQLWLSRKPKNCVVIVMESFSARFCGATGSPHRATPNFDRLSEKGILFDRAFSISTHTAQGIFGTLCSFPNLPGYDGVMKLPEGQQPIRSLPKIFSESGFRTVFLYNGLFSWDNKEGFFRNQGVEKFVGFHDYKNPKFVDPTWGVCDEDVFDRALEEFDQFHRQGNPFLGTVLTLSNHAPFNLPKIDSLMNLASDSLQGDRIRGIRYADYALGQFMEKAKSKEWFEDTLFVLVGDHGFGVPPILTEVGLLHMHVPLMFYGPELVREPGTVYSRVASQLDILPTLARLFELKTPHHAFGSDLTHTTAGNLGQAYVKATGEPYIGWIRGDHVVVVHPEEKSKIYHLDLREPPRVQEMSHETEGGILLQGEKEAKAFVGVGLKLLTEQRLGPADGVKIGSE